MTFDWRPPESWLRITAVDAHTAGEPLRIFTGGLPPIPGETILAKRAYAKKHLDHLRQATMWEPRGHADMYGAILTEPVTPDGHVGVLFLHNEGFSTMCGHGIIALTKVGLETGLLRPDQVTVLADGTAEVRIDTPAGRVTAHAIRNANGNIDHVSFRNVPSFVYTLDQTVVVPGLGSIPYDVAYGGAFYAFCRADDLGVDLTPAAFRQLIDVGMSIKHAVMESLPIRHPFEDDLGFLYGVIIVGPAHNPANHSRNVCIFADGEVDRSPTGTGVSARAALHVARGEIGLHEPFTVESILGTPFTGAAVETLRYGDYDAIIPQVSGTAYITGINEFIVDPNDPLAHGFLLR
jgi:trans-L-3-hydroxyproline dehydratase